MVKRKLKKRYGVFISILLCCLLLCSCALENASTQDVSSRIYSAGRPRPTESDQTSSVPQTPVNAYTIMIEKSRPEEAYLMPDFSKEVTDVRVTVKERAIDFYELKGNEDVKGSKTYQMYYGYFSDGKWSDMPSANYELKSLYEDKLDGWLALQTDHVTKIGPYILLAFQADAGIVSIKAPTVTVTDSLNSTVIPITEYYSTDDKRDAYSGKNHFFENMRGYGTEEYDFFATYSFDIWHFVVLDEKDFAPGYSVTVVTDWAESYLHKETTYTYDEIMAALNR